MKWAVVTLTFFIAFNTTAQRPGTLIVTNPFRDSDETDLLDHYYVIESEHRGSCTFKTLLFKKWLFNNSTSIVEHPFEDHSVKGYMRIYPKGQVTELAATCGKYHFRGFIETQRLYEMVFETSFELTESILKY